MESCEECGATEDVRVFGIDHTPLCPKHYILAERAVEHHEYIAAMRAQGIHIGSTWREIRDGFRRWKERQVG